MRWIDAFVGSRQSLRRTLHVNILVALCLSITLGGVIMISEFYDHLEENLKDALLNEARELASLIRPDDPFLGFDPGALRFRGDDGVYRYTILNAAGVPVVGSETRLLGPGAPQGEGDLLQSLLSDGRVFIVLDTSIAGQDYKVLVSTASKAETHWLELSDEVLDAAHWIIIGVLAILLAATLATRQALRPLRNVAVQAGGIGPKSIEHRLPTSGVPVEILPLVEAVNGAFQRLEDGYSAQRDFSSNVAHEVRTPLAVLRSSIDRIEDPSIREELRQDVGQLAQMFEKLIDLSRAEALGLETFDCVDLHEIAVRLARDMGVEALREGKRLAVTGADHARITGHAGLLGIALGNLVRNAVAYAPHDSEVEIVVVADPPGWRVLDRGAGIPDDQKTTLFQRFKRGESRGKAGSGIGLAIVKSVADAHNGTVEVADRPGGGSVFSFQLASGKKPTL